MDGLQTHKILIVSPHPDDETIGCGGLIMRAKKCDWDVFVLYMCMGYSRQFVTGATSMKSREPEIKKAAKFGHFKYTVLYKGKEFMRLDSVPQKELIEKIEDTIEKYKPTLVTVPYISSYDQDHRATATAAITALRPIPKAIRHQPNLILMYNEPYIWNTGEPFTPNFYIDSSMVELDKIELIQCHKTQVREDPFARSPQNLLRLDGFWGSQIGTQYAEAYKILKGSL